MTISYRTEKKEIDIRALFKRYHAKRIYDYILSNRPIYYRQKLTRILGLNIATINKWIKILHDIGSGFMAYPDYNKIGLTQIVFKSASTFNLSEKHVSEKLQKRARWFLRWKVDTVFPDSLSLLVSFSPNNPTCVNTLVKDYSDVIDIENYFVADVYIPNKLSSEFFECHSRYGLCLNNWKLISRHLNDVSKRFDTHEETIKSEKKRTYVKRLKIDLLDLLLLSHLEENALYRPHELAIKTGSTIVKINRHFRKHLLIPQVIAGTMLRYTKKAGKNFVIYTFMGRDEPNYVLSVLTTFSKVYGFMSGLMNSQDGRFIFNLGLPIYEIFEFTKYVPALLNEIFKEIEAFQIDKYSVKTYTIPYVPFDRSKREWTLSEEVIVETKEALMKKGLLA